MRSASIYHRAPRGAQTGGRRRIILLISLAATAAIEASLIALGIPHPLGLGGIPWLIVPVAVFWVMRRVMDRLGWDEEGEPAVRATLHDELMHEVGFETDYHRELGRRRERRRHARAWTLAHALLIVLLIAAVIELWGHYLPGLPRPMVLTAIVVLGIAQVFGWLKALKEAMYD